MTLPNVVVAGAPKCGTSSLFAWLTDHPDVCGSLAKETRYLLDPASPLERSRSYEQGGIQGYAAYFRHCAEREMPPRVVVEATPDYLYQETAREVLASLNPRPLILFMFRRPSARIYSHYQFARHNMAILPASTTFAQFLDAVRRDDDSLRQRRNLRQAISYSRYADHLAPWIDLFGLSGIRCYLTEDMQANPLRFARRVALDLGVEPGFFDSYSFTRRNETFSVRNQRLQRIRVELGRRIGSRQVKGPAARLYARLNTRGRQASPSPEERRLLAELDAEFADANDTLARLTGLDLGPWAG